MRRFTVPRPAFSWSWWYPQTVTGFEAEWVLVFA